MEENNTKKSLGLLDSRAVIVLALVAVNQPFTIWMLRSFFQNIPAELDEAAQLTGSLGTASSAYSRVSVG